jgi:hypothetical protein
MVAFLMHRGETRKFQEFCVENKEGDSYSLQFSYRYK